MPVFESKADFEARREAAQNGDFPSLSEGEYVFEIKDILTDDWGPNKYRDDGRVVLLDLDVIEDAEDPESPVLDTKGKTFDGSSWVRFPINGTFAKPIGFGFGPAGAGKARKVVASALEQNVNDPIKLSDDWKELVGGRFIASTTVNDKGFVNFETVRAYKKKKKDRSADRPKADTSMVETAAKVFAEDTDDDLPF